MSTMYTDRYGLPLSTPARAAAEHYIEGIDRALALNMGAQESLEAALDTAIDVLDPEPPLVERLVGQFLLQGQLPTAWLLRRHQDLDLGERERQEAQILQQPSNSG